MEACRLHACRPGMEARLAAELARTLPGSRSRALAPGWVWSALPPAAAAAEAAVAFAAQCLPAPEELAVPSVTIGARDLAARLMAGLAEHDGPWRLHVFCVETEGSAARAGRCDLVRTQALDLLRRRQKRLLRTLTTDPLSPWQPGERLAQLALVAPRRAFFSLADAGLRHRLRRCLSRLPGGRVEVPDDPAPPSRAYRKLLEAEVHLGRTITAGETCVDLGAAPGGWTHVALARGACVVAVDRSPLREGLMRAPRLAFVRGDAFRHVPAEPPVDWLLSDVVARPPRVRALLETWLAQRWCRRFVVTVKFQGEDDDAALEPLKASLRASGCEFFVRQLGENRNEVTACGERPAE